MEAARRAARDGEARRGKDARQRELCRIISEREALHVKLQHLRDEVRLVEANIEAVALREEQLLSEMVGQSDSDLDDSDDTDSEGPSMRFCLPGTGTTATPSSGPVYFELEGSDAAKLIGLTPRQPRVVNMSPSSGEQPPSARGGEDYEDCFELGVAKCRLCGARFPLDVDSIQRHSRSCFRTSDDKLPLMGRCSTCGEQMPLTMKAVEAHRCSCVVRRQAKLGAPRTGQTQPGGR